ncbi:hypothetical protein GCM10016455_10520 [Aliiroseovarius zhejiangensis]|uniref:Uncharacterized protein n=1 Tax=Aliiroseovarius zhejiangensis TaxID=1632025 RepID=A0ABQ3ISG9_9RHOB|nr:hypothetical protein [Aliiroseovarius zhejiangensis]GHE92389.1 hypothetical protein GCM10016455_10520 [Aliiroseovarius zhejiangensis]
MSDISELETRITTALERISKGLSALPAQATGAADDIARLTTELEEERTANRQLAERVKALQQSRTEEVAALRNEVERLTAQLTANEDVLAKLRQVNADLRANSNALRDAVGGGLADAGLVNAAMATELEGLRVAQSADRAELDAVLGELGQLIFEKGLKPSGSAETGREGADA